MPPAARIGLPLSACSPVGKGAMLGVVVVVRVVVALRVVVVRVLEVADAVLDALGVVVPPPGSVDTGFGAKADRTVSGEAMATLMTPSATITTSAIAALAQRRCLAGAGCGCDGTGYGCGAEAGTYAGGVDGQPACAGGTGRGG